MKQGERNSGRFFLAVALALTAFGVWLRAQSVEHALLFSDEWHSLRLVDLDYARLFSTFDRFGSGLAYPLLQRLAADVSGASHWSIRGPAFAGGLLTIVATFLFARRRFGATVAGGAALLVALNSFSIFYSGFARAYSLVAALSMVFVAAATGLLENETPRRRDLIGLVVCGALLPYLHLTAAGVVALVGAATVVALVSSRRKRAAALSASALILALLLTLALHAPAWSSIEEFVGKKSGGNYFGSFGPIDVVALLVGSRALAWVVVIGAPVAAAAFARRRGVASVPLIVGCFAPAIVLLVARPFGGPYAYARYAIAAVPLLALLAAWTVERAFGALTLDPERRQRSARLGLVALALAVFWVGRRDVIHLPEFGATYLELEALPAFDAPFPETPALYARIAADTDARRIVELPYLHRRSMHLYRNYALQHGKEVVPAFLLEPFPGAPQTYRALLAPDAGPVLSREWADWVVAHRAVADELARYWRFVYAQEPNPATRAYMNRHERFGGEPPPIGRRSIARLTELLGAPDYEDDVVVAWRLGDPPGAQSESPPR